MLRSTVRHRSRRVWCVWCVLLRHQLGAFTFVPSAPTCTLHCLTEPCHMGHPFCTACSHSWCCPPPPLEYWLWTLLWPGCSRCSGGDAQGGRLGWHGRGPCAAALKRPHVRAEEPARTVPDTLQPVLNREMAKPCPEGSRALLAAQCSGVGLPADPRQLHEDMHAYLAGCGVDGVKARGTCKPQRESWPCMGGTRTLQRSGLHSSARPDAKAAPNMSVPF